MPHFFERAALILLAGTALTVCASSAMAQAPVVQLPPPAVEPPLLAFAAPGVDAFARAPAATYKVRRGDTLAEIADRLDTTVEALAKANGLKRPYRLRPGQTLKNPKAPKVQAARTPSRTSGAREGGGTYTVRRGDTLFAIAQRTGVSVEALRAANGMGRSSSLAAGQKLKLPGRGGDEPETAAAPDEDAALAERMARAAEPRPQAEEPAPATPSSDRGATTERSVTGRVITIDVPGKSYRVKKGDNLERVANRLDSDIAELARLNKLKKPYRLQPGQTIRGPGTSAKAYVTVRGDTLAEVARRFGVSEAELRSTNGLRRGASLGAGRRLRLPFGYRDRGPLTTTVRTPEAPRTPPPSSFETPPPVGQRLPPPRSAPRPPEVVLPDQPQPYRPTPGTTPGTTPYPRTGPVAGAPVASPPVSDAQISEMGRGLFVWPIQGQVLSGFGGRGQGPRNDGLNIRANAGDPVRAAASGDVVYAGDQVPGFGNLVLIKHADGWVTAYGHLGHVDVRMQQKVSQGQTIGQAGTTGGVSEPQLHFEVRYAPTPQERARPVDPALVLPK
jgi:murein DD-endopeptidase MepM/ murein hydrolase activator NlpD